MTFRILHFCSYYSQHAHNNIRQRTDDEWAGFRFSVTVKSRTCGATRYFVPEPPGPKKEISRDLLGNARPIFGRFILSLASSTGRKDIAIVPVPSKDSFGTPEFRSLAMVREAMPTEARALLPIVRFTSEVQQAHVGGARDFDHIYKNIGVTHRIVPPRNIVLVDDIMTKGGSMLATRRRLVEAGHNVLFGVVCGRTTWSDSDVFAHGHVDVDDTATQVPFLGEEA